MIGVRQRQGPATPPDVNAAISDLRDSWPWLAETVIPGPTSPPLERHVTADQAEVERREQARDREAAYLSVRAGTVGPGGHADAARIGAIAARTLATQRIRRLAEQVYAAQHGTILALAWTVPDPTRRPPRTPCPVCTDRGRCYCDRMDAVVYGSLNILTAALYAGGLPKGMLDTMLRVVERVDRQVRRAAHTGEVLIVLKARCPACGDRDLVVNCTSPDQDDWTIRCRAPLCECAGHGCPCGCPTRYKGRRHLWPARGGSWHRLARRLGVSTTDLIAEVLRRRPRTIGSIQIGGGRAW